MLAVAHGPRPTGRRLWIGTAADYELPPDLSLVGDPADWLARVAEAVAADPQLRVDGRRTRLAVAAAIVAVHWSSTTQLAIAGHTTLAERVLADTGRRVGRSTVGNHVRALIDGGWLAVAQHGCSAAIAGRNLAPIYVLTAPWSAEDEAALQAGLRHLEAASAVDGHHPKGFRDLVKVDDSYGRSFAAKIPRQRPARLEHPELFVPRNHRERALVALWILGWMGWGARPQRVLSYWAADLAKGLSRFFAAGWTGELIVAAMQATPEGEAHWSATGPGSDVRDPVKLAMTRMRPWRTGPAGAPRPPARAAEAPRRGPQRPARVRERPYEPPPPAMRAPGAVRAQMSADILAGRQRRQQQDAERWAARRAAWRGAALSAT